MRFLQFLIYVVNSSKITLLSSYKINTSDATEYIVDRTKKHLLKRYV